MKTKESEEMKRVSEEILNKWRGFGVLSGLENGSINEWRCAKSFDEMAEHCLSNEEYNNGKFITAIFAIIRRCLCTGKNRITRIIHPQEIIDTLKSVTVKESFDIIDKCLPIKGKTGIKSVGRRLLRNFCEKICLSGCYENLSCLDFMLLEDEKLIEKIKFFQDITSCDFEAEMYIVFSEVIKENLKK